MRPGGGGLFRYPRHLGAILEPRGAPEQASNNRCGRTDRSTLGRNAAYRSRIEARIGLRMIMMPTFPRSPLSFRTVSFPQYGWKAGFSGGAFLGDQRLKPAPGIRRPISSLRPPFVHLVITSIIPYCAGSRTR
jgi:hypothetical protein